jgi:membrane-bound lytic murein transglycosylase D
MPAEAPPEVAALIDPEALQQQALDLCQAAEAALERGDAPAAIEALDRAYETLLTLPGDDASLQAQDDLRRLVADLLHRAYRPHARAAGAPALDLALPLTDNEHVQREIRSFTGPERDVFIEAYRRSGLYRPMILAKLKEHGLPSQLSWLPLVESAFKVRALSHAGALGLWQFIRSTGQRYGLSRDEWIDLRLDPERATDAALAYLADLHAAFGDWPKALAAYNCGEAGVARRQRGTNGDYQDFWDLYERLPLETRRYVPRFIATLMILEDPARYGLTLPEPLAPPAAPPTVTIARAVDLDKLDAALGLDKGTLRELNPALRSGATPPRAYELAVPEGAQERVAAAAQGLPEFKRPVHSADTHRVRSGETLGLIARRYRTSVRAIVALNGLRNAHRLRLGQVLRIPTRR